MLSIFGPKICPIKVSWSVSRSSLSSSAVRLDASNHFRFEVKSAWHSKPPLPLPRHKARLSGLPSTSPIRLWREEILKLASTKRSMGDDSLFAVQTQKGLMCGVADGVGSWIDQGIDPSMFSSALMFYCERKALASSASIDPASPESDFQIDLKELLAGAYLQVVDDKDVLAGSSTACVASFESGNGQMTVANLGDSSFYILRNGKCIHQEPAQTHYFNCPLQLAKSGSSESYSDDPRSAAVSQAALQHNDVVVLVTDGFTDNVWPEELEVLCKSTMTDEADEDRLSHFTRAACEYARRCGLKQDKRSPFEAEAEKHGYKAPGGKVDDVTVLAVLCQET